MIPGARLPQLQLHLSNRLESLAAALAKALAAETGDPLRPRTVVVASAGTARWLSMQLARHSGLAMGIRYPFPRNLIDELVGGLLGANRQCSPQFTRDAMAWWLHDHLPALLARAEFAPIRGGLAAGDEVRRFALARRLGGLFDQYQVYRPEMLRGWGGGDEPGDWQAELWRALRGDFPGEASFADLHAEVAALPETAVDPERLPSRLSVFGLNTLPPAFIDILWKASLFLPVDAYVLSPTDQYWSDMQTPKQRLRSAAADGPAEGNPLALSIGRLGREFIEQLLERDFDKAGEYFDHPLGSTLLGGLQADLLSLHDGRRAADKPVVAATDRSIEVHSCHGHMREVEVLHDRLLSLFEHDATLRPRDVLVMAPDIDAYAPGIQAVFGTPESAELRIPYSLADQSLRHRVVVADALLRVLELGRSRFEAARVLATLECLPIRQRFGFDDLDLQRLRRWIDEGGIVWALDAEHRAALGFPAESIGTWQHGKSTLLAGYAMNGHGPRLHAGVQPLEDLEGDHLESLQRVLTALELFGAVAADLAMPRDRRGWAETLGGIAQSLFGGQPERAAELRDVLAVIDELAGSDPLDRRARLPAEVVLSHLENRLSEQPASGGFFDGRVTCCALQPLRAIPARVICLLGMNDGEFPRQGTRLAFDRIAQQPQRGDRSPREDDRHLFFEAILGARDHLYISYRGQSHRDTLERAPAGVVVELRDYLQEAFAMPAAVRQRLQIRHPLQAFSRRYFVADELQSFSRMNAAAAARVQAAPALPRQFFDPPLAEPPPEWRRLSPQQLCDFFVQPIRCLGEWRLGLRLEERSREIVDHEPRDLDARSAYPLREAMTAAALEGRQPPLWEAARARGKVPYGAPGVALERENALLVAGLVTRVRAAGGTAACESLQLARTLGPWTLEGPIDGIYGGRLLRFRCAKLKAVDQVRAWILHLLVNLAAPGTGTLALDYTGEAVRFESPGSGEWTASQLCSLLDLYWQGMQQPLRFFPRSSLAFVEAEREGKSALRAAEKSWYPVPYQAAPSESENLWNEWVFGAQSPFDESFAITARAVCGPLLDHRRAADGEADE